MINNIYNNKASLNNKISTKDLYDTTTSSNVVIKGAIIKKDGKNIRIKSDDNTLLDIVTKSNLTAKQGEMLLIKKSEIETITKISYEQVEKEKEKRQEEIDELKKADVSPTDENIDALEHLKNTEIPLTKENILRFATIKGSLSQIANVNINQITKLINSGYNIEDMSIFDVQEALKTTQISFSDKLTVALESKMNTKITYDEAREISNKIYGSKMGKDIQDIIISLKQNGIEVTKENVDNIHDAFSKLYDIKSINNEDIARAVKIDETNISIDTLYNIKNYVSVSSIAVSTVSYSSNTNIPTDKQLEDMSEELIKTLKAMGFDKEELNIAKSIIKQDLELNAENIQDIKQIQLDLENIQNMLDKDVAAMLVKSNIDISSMDIRSLLQEVIALNQSIEQINDMNFTKEDMDLAGSLIEAMKQINSNTVLGNISVRAILNSSEIGKDVYDKLFSDNSKYATTSYEKSISIKSAIVLNSVDTIDFNLIDYRNTNISLKYIANKYSLLKQDNEANSKIELEKLQYKVQETVQIQIKTEITKHYDYLRTNMRASHITQMIRDGINPFESDIRSISSIIREQNTRQKNISNAIHDINDEEMNFATTNILLNESSTTISSVKKSVDIYKNKNNYIDIIKEIAKEADEIDFKEIKDITRRIEQTLKEHTNLTKDSMRENISNIYKDFREMEKLVSQSERPDKEGIKKQLENLADNIRNTQKMSSNNEMVQVPFNMNGESNNANVYAKTKKNKKGKIDPQDMSLLIDLNTKNLGKMGFYIKVENKKLSIKVSGNSKSMEKIKSSVNSLDNNLSSLGYNIDFIDLTSPENKAKISFVDENTRDTNNKVDFFI